MKISRDCGIYGWGFEYSPSLWIENQQYKVTTVCRINIINYFINNFPCVLYRVPLKTWFVLAKIIFILWNADGH